MVSLWTEGEKITGNFASWRVLVCCGFSLLFSYLLRANNRSIGGQREVDPGVGHQVGLELVQIHVESSVKPETGRDRGEYLRDEPVEVSVGGTLHTEVVLAEIVDGLVVHQEGHISVLQCCVGEEDRVVGLHDGRGDLADRQLGYR